MISIMKNKVLRLLKSLLAVIFWVLVWHFAAGQANKNLLLPIPLPLDTLRAFFEAAGEAVFWKSVFASIWHIIAGFGAAVLLGLVCGLLSGNLPVFKTLTAPIVHLIRSVPVAAFIILAWLWVPDAFLPSFISFLMVFPIVWSQVESGLLAVDIRTVEMAKIMGMSKGGIIRNIKLPTVMPFFRNSCITGLGFAWKSGVAAEVICNPTGSIGAMLSSAKGIIDYPRVFAITLTIVLLSLVMEKAVAIVWREKRYDKIR